MDEQIQFNLELKSSDSETLPTSFQNHQIMS